MSISKVLLTGGTGFLGANFIHELVLAGMDVFCLIRGADISLAQERLRLSLKAFFPGEAEKVMESIVVLKGDFTQERLGMPPALYDEVGGSIDAVVHLGAYVKHFGSKSNFYRVNVSGTENIARFCCQYHKFLLFSSSVAIFKQHNADVNLYANSKSMAEKRINDYVGMGLKRCILRLGALTWRSDNGFFQENVEENALYARLRFILKGGMIPKQMLEHRISMTPVDLCCRAMRIHLENQTEGIGSLYNDKMITYKSFVRSVEKLGYVIQTKDICDFHEIYRYGSSLGMKTEAIVGFYLYYRRRGSEHQFSVKNMEMEKVLRENGFAWIEPNVEYFKKFLIEE